MSLARSEKSRACKYALLQHDLDGYEQQPMLLISGSRDSYVTPVVTKTIARKFDQQNNVWIAEKAKHNRARKKYQAEYDQRIVAHFTKAFAATTRTDRFESVSPSRKLTSRRLEPANEM